jgi:hypothetical protein
MVQLLSTPQLTPQASSHGARLSRALAVGGTVFAAALLIAALILWTRYGSAVFFEMIASGFAACF